MVPRSAGAGRCNASTVLKSMAWATPARSALRVAKSVMRNDTSPAQIGTAGFTGAPVSTTHVVTSGIAGTMVASGAGVQGNTIRQIAAAWILTLPATILLSGGLFWLLS